jgi:outer membrane protein OmpA-like peptidoglycan-associated protein
MRSMLLLVIGTAFGVSAFAQARPQSPADVESTSSTPIFVVNVTSRNVEAINYRYRGGATDVDLAGTALMPSADGKAKVRSKRGTMEVEAEFGNLQSPTTFGGEYLTYVLWAISPDGRAVNLGEVLVGENDRSKLTATTDLQAFALIVTAEPYFAVRQPSDVVVLENVVGDDTKGTAEAVKAKYELMERGGYIPTGYKFDPVVLNAGLPLAFLEARNAVRIAQSEGAEKYASDSYQHAAQLMNTADSYATDGHSDRKQLIATSRETVQTAEDAREIAVKRMGEDRRADERQTSAEAVAQSQAQADDATKQKEQAQSDAAQARAEMAANQVTSSAQITAAQTDADQSRAIAQEAQQNEHQADSEKAVMRAQLSEQLNKVLETRDSARGLIVSMSDVLFDTGEYSLKPGAKEKLAKIAGILIAYPSLNIEVCGYTDNVGTDEMNQKLSENRAGAVRDYLVEQGVVADSVTSEGFGNTLPVASNDNPAGRQENRRVELVLSGEAIGSPADATTGSLR